MDLFLSNQCDNRYDFCGFCGKQATEIDELCRNCGSKKNEFKYFIGSY